MSEPNFLSQYEIAILDEGIAIRLTSMQSPGRPGHQLAFLLRAATGTELAQDIMAAVEEWKKKHQH